MRLKQDNLCLCGTLKRVHGFAACPVDTIFKYGALFRRILDEFELLGEFPTPDDLLWIASESLSRDIQTT